MAIEATFTDTNVVLDYVLDDPVWGPWSAARLSSAAAIGPLVCNHVVFAELSAGYASREAVEIVLDGLGIAVLDIPLDAAFLAGKAFAAYRRRGGTKTGVLPDFLIGAHAAVADFALLTRDPRRYRTDFPTLRLVAPDGDA